MRLFLLTLLLPIVTSAALTDVDKQEIVTKNILLNSGFEGSKANWTASGGTFSVVTSGSNLLIGRVSATWDSGAAAQTLTSTAVTIPNGLKGRNGIAWCSFLTPSGTATHTIQVYDGSNILSSGDIVSATSPIKSGVTFIIPSSGSISLRIVSVASDEPLIAIDECYLGLSDNVRDANYIGPWITWTPTGAFTTNTTYTGRYRQVGNTGEFIARASFSGAPNAVTNTFNLPTNLTIDTNALVTSSTGQNSQTLGQSVLKNDDAAVELELLTGHVILSSSTAVSASAFDPTSGATHYLRQVTATNPISIAANDFLEVKFTAPIVEWSGSILAFTPDVVANSWSGYHDSTCSWARTNTAYGDPTADATCVLTQRANQNFGTVTTYTVTNAMPGIVFTPKRSGKYVVSALINDFRCGGTGAEYAVNITDGTTIVAEVTAECTSGGANSIPVVVSGHYSALGTSQVSLRLNYKSTTGAMTINPNAYGNAIEWTISQIDQQIPAPLLVNSVVNPRSAVTNICSGYVVNGGTPTLTREDGDCIGTLVDNGTGDTTLPFNTGTFSGTPNCVCTTYSGSGRYCEIDSTTALSSTVLRVQTLDAAALANDVDFMFICIGPR